MYYRQSDYGNIPYPARGYESATVKSGGCGVCVMAMALDDLLGTASDIRALAKYAIDCGARVPGGTDMNIFCRAVTADHGFDYRAGNSVDDLPGALSDGAVIIANVGGDRPGYTGLFSMGGHYVYCHAMAGGRLTVWDPGYYSGKFSKPGRQGKVEIDFPDIYVSPVYLDRDTENRRPRYHILSNPSAPVWKEEDEMVYNTLEEVPQWGQPTIAKLLEKGFLQGDGRGLALNETMLRVLVINDRAGLYD